MERIVEIEKIVEVKVPVYMEKLVEIEVERLVEVPIETMYYNFRIDVGI